LTFVLFSPNVIEPRTTHRDLTVIDFQTEQAEQPDLTKQNQPQTAPTSHVSGAKFEHHSENSPQATPAAETLGVDLDRSDDPFGNFHELPLQVPSITNSPRCAPARRIQPAQPNQPAPPSSFTHSTNPSTPKRPPTPHRVRMVRVDAWAVPVSANWSRTRTEARKIRHGIRSTDWALPF